MKGLFRSKDRRDRSAPSIPRSEGGRAKKIAIIVLALLFLVSAALIAWKAVRLGNSAAAAIRDTSGLIASLEKMQREPLDRAALERLMLSAESSAGSLQRLYIEVRPVVPLLRLARPLPDGIGWIADVPDLLDVAVPLSRVAVATIRPIAEAGLDGRGDQKQLSRYLAAASSLGPQLPYIEGDLASAISVLERLKDRPLRGLLRPYSHQLNALGELLPGAKEGLKLLEVLGPAIGMEGRRTYLLLGQNNQEIRATGGFIGSVGVITLENGTVASLEYRSSYEMDKEASVPLPPEPLAQHLGLGGWYLRDANWWPDFPTSAAQVEQAWLRAGKGPIDGIVALDNMAVERVMRVVGDLEVPGYGRVVADEFERKAAEQLYSRSALSSAEMFHKAKGEFLGAVGRALIDRLFSLPLERLLPLSREVGQLLDTKHIQLAVKDRRLADLVDAHGWDGAIPDVSGDSLYVVDTTVSYGDSYSFIKTDVVLEAQLEKSGSERHTLVLHYYNSFPEGLPSWMPQMMVRGAYFDPASGILVEKAGFWANWLRVYLPEDAKDVEVEGLDEVAPIVKQFGRVVVAGYLPLNPGEKRDVRVSYAGSAMAVDEGVYDLFLQKQAGLECRPTSVVAKWKDGGSSEYRGCPTKDVWIVLRKTN